MRLVTSVKKAVRDRLIARAGGIDLSRLDKVPDAVSWPLRRDVMAPSARLQETRDDEPVQRAGLAPRAGRLAGHRRRGVPRGAQRHHVVLHRHPALHGQERVGDRR